MNNKQSGFTLIELMIVVVIIGILASVSLPAYKNHIERANAAKALTQIQEQKLAQSELFSIGASTAPVDGSTIVSETIDGVVVTLTAKVSNNQLSWVCSTNKTAFKGCGL